jgi:hypothetical protein
VSRIVRVHYRSEQPFMDEQKRAQATERARVLRAAYERERQANEQRLISPIAMPHDKPQDSNKRVVRWWPKERAVNGRRA